MKLLFAIKALELPGGGAERVLAEVTAGLAERGHQVNLLSFDKPGGRSFYDLHRQVHRLPLGIGAVGGSTGPGEAVRRIKAMRKVARSLCPDVAIGFMHSSYIPLGLALAGTAIPLIASEHIAYDHYRTRPLQAALLKLTPRIADAVTIISPKIREGFPASLRRRMTVIPNPVSVSEGEKADVSGRGRPVKTLLSVGRLAEQKEHHTLLEAFAQITAEFPDWRLRIVGEGALRTALEAQIRRFGLCDRVALPGATPDIGREYLDAQLFVMSSSYESFGLATAEALARGLPAIGFADCPGTNELIEHGRNGLLVEGPDRSLALAEGLRKAMGSEASRREWAERAPQSVSSYRLSDVVDAWENLLRSLVGGERRLSGERSSG